MKAVIYTRVSTDEQAKHGLSLEGQLKSCTEYAVRNDYEVAEVFTDAGESAKTANRPKLLEMVKYCQQNKGAINCVIVWKLDRFARNAADHMLMAAHLKSAGVKLASVIEPIDDTLTGKLMEGILANYAEFENGMRAERSAGGMKARLEEGDGRSLLR